MGLLTELNERFAIMDLGSNSFHLLLGVITSSKIWKVEQHINEVVQLRAGLTQEGTLSWESINRALICLDYFAKILTKFSPNPDKVRIIGTATLRFAKNRDLFLSHATQKLGYPIEVISGTEEAEFIYLAFSSYLQKVGSPQSARQRLLGIDVGGGSTELVVGLNGKPDVSVSLPVGCVELQTYFLGKLAVNRQNFDLALECVEAQFAAQIPAIQAIIDCGWQQVYAGSGSAEILIEISRLLNLEIGRELSTESLVQIKEYLISLKDAQHFKALALKEHQLLILPGVVTIFLALMKYLRLERITVLPVSLRHGVLAAMHLATVQPLAHNN
jgi:exopolyphosphatase/guanosine-5'-triphosphate,3'-diphosphate pyrophosphatase